METATTEPGLGILQATGLQLFDVDDDAVSEALNFLIGDAPHVPGAPVYEALRWVPATQLPADDTTYTLQVLYPDGGMSIYAGWWDGQDWRHEASAGTVRGTVRFYCTPKGPAA